MPMRDACFVFSVCREQFSVGGRGGMRESCLPNGLYDRQVFLSLLFVVL